MAEDRSKEFHTDRDIRDFILREARKQPFQDILSQRGNGSLSRFQSTRKPTGDMFEVYVNGVFQNVETDYVRIDDVTIVFLTPPPTNARIMVKYFDN